MIFKNLHEVVAGLAEINGPEPDSVESPTRGNACDVEQRQAVILGEDVGERILIVEDRRVEAVEAAFRLCSSQQFVDLSGDVGVEFSLRKAKSLAGEAIRVGLRCIRRRLLVAIQWGSV